MPEGLYFDIFSSLCDNDMQKKLNNIRGIKKMSEKEIWEQVEKMFLASNPMYMRNIQALETRIIKGESVSKIMNSRPVRQSLSDNQWEYAVPPKLVGQPMDRPGPTRLVGPSPTKLVGQPMGVCRSDEACRTTNGSARSDKTGRTIVGTWRIFLARRKKWRILFSN